MNDDFYKSIQDNLENRPEPAFREGAWKAMEKQLADSKQVETTSFWVGKWWLPLLLLLLVGMTGSNFWLYHQLQSVQSNQLIVQTDTIYRSKIIFQSDTVFQTKVIKEFISIDKNTPSKSSTKENVFHAANFYPSINYFKRRENPSQVNSVAIQKEIADLTESFGQLAAIPLLDTIGEFSQMVYPVNSRYWINSPETLPKLSNHRILLDNRDIIEDKSPDLRVNSPMLSFDKLPNLTPYLLSWNRKAPNLFIEIPYVKKRKTLRQKVHEMRPKTFHLGLNGGFANTNNSELDNIGGYTFGLNASIGFSPNFLIWSEAAFMELKYSSKTIEESLGVPNITPPQDNFEFLEAEVTQPAYQFGLGIQYLFNAPNRWKPYLGIGYGMVALVPYEVAYEFTDPLIDVDLTLEQVVKRNDLLKGQLLLKAGLEYEFTNRWAWHLEGLYRKSNSPVGLSSPNVLSVRSGIIYRF